MTEIIHSKDCDNSPKNQRVEEAAVAILTVRHAITHGKCERSLYMRDSANGRFTPTNSAVAPE
jgi:hypothetical protein